MTGRPALPGTTGDRSELIETGIFDLLVYYDARGRIDRDQLAERVARRVESDHQHAATDSQIALTDRTTGRLVAADQWVAITGVLHQHLAAHPELLDGLLIDLANIQPVYERAQ